MSSGLSQRQLKSLLTELDPQACKVALMVCRAYKNPNEKRVYAEIRSEFNERKRQAQRAARALTKLSKGLRELNISIKSSLKNVRIFKAMQITGISISFGWSSGGS